ncbi:MAG: 4,5-DOPA dioxygenase extradiol, partial [Ignavibacteriales bacterium]|nr:4,5-DOPA dioxygenase extradiol [Ignavibacteriales bacterium]
MKRKEFLSTLAMIPFMGGTMKLNDLKNITDEHQHTERMPLLFVGHGNPMNAIDDNAFSRAWKEMGTKLPKPQAILSVSAH